MFTLSETDAGRLMEGVCVDPKNVRDAVRDTMWVMAGAVFLFPLVAMIFLGFNVAYVFLFMLAAMFFLVGLMANGSGLA